MDVRPLASPLEGASQCVGHSGDVMAQTSFTRRGYRGGFWVIGTPPYGCLQFFFACFFAFCCPGPCNNLDLLLKFLYEPPPPSECTKPPLLNPGSAPVHCLLTLYSRQSANPFGKVCLGRDEKCPPPPQKKTTKKTGPHGALPPKILIQPINLVARNIEDNMYLDRGKAVRVL